MAKSKRNIGMEILEGIREIKRGEWQATEDTRARRASEKRPGPRNGSFLLRSNVGNYLTIRQRPSEVCQSFWFRI